MKGKGMKKNVATSSSEDDDSDVEKNFALLKKRGGGGGAEEKEELYDEGEEEEEDLSNGDEEGSCGGEEEDEEGSGGEEEEEEEEEDDEDEDEEPNDAGGSSELQTSEDIKTELSNMSFEEIMKLQNKVGTKVYNQVAYGSSSSGGGGMSKQQQQQQQKKKKRLNKNRPMEISAKKPAPFLRQVVAVSKRASRDPRFDDLSGEYKPEIFEKTYRFINDIKQREKEMVKKQLKRTKKNNTRKEKLQFLLKRMENQERARLSREQQRERELHFKKLQRERANQGDRPFFLKSSEKKKLQLAEKYQELKKSGKLENFLSKKRKRNAGKDRRKLPDQHLHGNKAR